MNVAENKVVGMHYTVKDDEGQVLDTSEGRDALVYLHGSGSIVPGLESALTGKETGEEVTVTLEPSQAYGERNEQLVQEVPKTAFEGVDDLEVGMRFQAQTSEGPMPIRIAQIQDDKVTVDANHELAGKRLHFDVSIESIRDATQEEIDHGHAH